MTGDLDIQAQKTDWILGKGDGSTIKVELRILQLPSGTLQGDALALGHLRRHPRPVQPVSHLRQQVLAGGWGVGHQTCVVCVLHDVDAAEGARELSKVNPRGDGVNESVHHCIEDDYRQRVALVHPLLQRDEGSLPTVCDDSGLKTTVESLENGEELWWSMVVLEGELDQ